MTTSDLLPIPRRGTPKYRAWIRRLLIIGALPVVTAAVGIAALRTSDLYTLTGTPVFSDVSGYLAFILVMLMILGLIAVFDRRTRFAGFATMAIAFFLNPLWALFVRWTLGIQ